MNTAPEPPAHAVMLFDGVCRFCNGSVNYVIDHDPDGYFHFASQQSPAGAALLRRHGLTEQTLKTMVLIEGGRCYTRSDAVLRIFRRLRGPARLLALGASAVPRFVRDPAYSWIARNRYRWFGQADACRVPTPEVAVRFLHDEADVADTAPTASPAPTNHP